jgi:hypothetical protein
LIWHPGAWLVQATPQHTPRGRGYDQSLHYFHHANDVRACKAAAAHGCPPTPRPVPEPGPLAHMQYWSYQVGHCPSPKNKSLNVPVTDLWEGVLNGGE